ncbi:MAG: N-acetylmuramoyl-L-alanine amidase [Bacteroidota bacterium]
MPSLKPTFLFLISIIWLSPKSFSQDSAIAAQIKYYTQKTEKQLDKEKALSTFYSINANGISIYASTQNKLKASPEFHISWNKLDDFNTHLKSCTTEESFQTYLKGNYDSAKPCISLTKKSPPKSNTKTGKLSGLKIAIDPGHIAGDMEMGDIEKKCLTFKCDSLKGLKDSIAISEGMLTFATAKLLKDKLEAEGAEVFMTRTFNGSSAFGLTFDQWLKTSYAGTVDSLFKAGKISLSQKQFFMGSKASKRDKFRVIFKDVELSKRAKIINNYKPDLTIIIHFNVDETNTNWTKPADKNFNMTFVGGAFMKNDLSSPEKRFQFLRLLISDDLEKSTALSSAVIKSFEKNLNVKTASAKDATYLMEGCLPTSEPGVYCRNLQLTRYIHGPLVYGETLYQDNLNECILLNKECDKTKNERIQQVAEAYFQGILNYVQKQ